MLAPQKVTKEEGTQPSRPDGSLALLNKISGHETHPSGLHTTQPTAGFGQSLPSSLFCLRYSAWWDGIYLAKFALHKCGRFKNQILLLTLLNDGARGCSGSPSAAPSNAGLTGVFGHRLSEFRNKPRSVWLVRASFDGRPASRVAQGTSGSWGALSFGYLFFGQAKKSNSPKRRKAISQSTSQPHI